MQAVANPIALELADEVKKAVSPNEFVNETLKRKKELEELWEYMKRREQKIEAVGMEKMIITSIRNGFSSDVILTLSKEAGVTESRLEELRKLAELG